MRFELGDVVAAAPPREDAGMDARVERLHAPAEHLREARELLHARDGEPGVGERGRGAAARDQLEPEVGETAGERHEAGLVVNRDQRAHSVRTTSGRSRCSTACTRSRSVSTVSPARTGTGSLAMTGPVSIPAST